VGGRGLGEGILRVRGQLLLVQGVRWEGTKGTLVNVPGDRRDPRSLVGVQPMEFADETRAEVGKLRPVGHIRPIALFNPFTLTVHYITFTFVVFISLFFFLPAIDSLIGSTRSEDTNMRTAVWVQTQTPSYPDL